MDQSLSDLAGRIAAAAATAPTPAAAPAPPPQRLDVHLFGGPDTAIVERYLRELLDHVQSLITQGAQMANTIAEMQTAFQAKLDAITAAVTAETAVDQSVVTLLKGLADQNTQLKTDLLAAMDAINKGADASVLQPIADALDVQTKAISDNTKTISDAVAANTPASPVAPATPPAAPTT